MWETSMSEEAMSDRRQIFAFSGILQSKTDKRTNFDLVNHALSLAGKTQSQRVC